LSRPTDNRLLRSSPAVAPPDDAPNAPAQLGMDQQFIQARSGEPAALETLVRVHQRAVYSLALRMLGTRELAEDLTQEVFMEMNDNLSTIQSSEHLTFWLRRVTTNRAIDELRRRARIEITALDEESPVCSAADEADPLLQRHLSRLLAELAPAARAVMLLRYQEDLDPMEIAHTLDMPVNSVKSHLKRSLDFMRQRLTDTADTRREDH
jgi:RNA polymerase sigma-70 factor (ECF subfamily)